MRKNLFLILVSIITLTSNAQTDNKIIIGNVDSVHSTILNEKRKVWVYVPNMNSGMQNTGQRFPVLYLLDGDAHFQSVVGNDPAAKPGKWQYDLSRNDRGGYSQHGQNKGSYTNAY